MSDKIIKFPEPVRAVYVDDTPVGESTMKEFMKYACDEYIKYDFRDHTGNPEAALQNMKFMAFCDGYRKGFALGKGVSTEEEKECLPV